MPTAILSTPDTELKDIFLEGLKLIRHEPSIPDRIGFDIDQAAKEKKAMRLSDRSWYEDLNGILPGCEWIRGAVAFDPDKLTLFEGRPRLLDPESVFTDAVPCTFGFGYVQASRGSTEGFDSDSDLF